MPILYNNMLHSFNGMGVVRGGGGGGGAYPPIFEVEGCTLLVIKVDSFIDPILKCISFSLAHSSL